MIMELSDTLTDRVADGANYIINDWTGDAYPDLDDEYTLSHKNFSRWRVQIFRHKFGYKAVKE